MSYNSLGINYEFTAIYGSTLTRKFIVLPRGKILETVRIAPDSQTAGIKVDVSINDRGTKSDSEEFDINLGNAWLRGTSLISKEFTWFGKLTIPENVASYLEMNWLNKTGTDIPMIVGILLSEQKITK